MIISYKVGKRNGDTTRAFLTDLRQRVINVPQISSDGFTPYEEAMAAIFKDDVHYGQIVKQYMAEPPVNAARRYSPGVVVGVRKRQVIGKPAKFQICASFVERTNLSLRMAQRRFTRLTNGFSKKLENHEAAVSLLSRTSICAGSTRRCGQRRLWYTASH